MNSKENYQQYVSRYASEVAALKRKNTVFITGELLAFGGILAFLICYFEMCIRDRIYSYKNAKSANNYGVELDIRKNLGFIGLKDFSWSFNGALIKSKDVYKRQVVDTSSTMLLNRAFMP